MEPYYILKVKHFTDVQQLSSVQQIGFDNVYDDEPSASLIKKGDSIKNYIKYELTCENIENVRGRACGTSDIFEQFISIRSSYVYYSSLLNCMFFHSKRAHFNQFCKTFDKAVEISYNKLSIDFKQIIDNQNSLNIRGIWFGNLLDANVHSLHLMGNKVENSDKYQKLLEEGDIKNITLVYDYKGKDVKIMVTQDGGIIFYDKITETDALKTLEYIYTNLISPAITSVS